MGKPIAVILILSVVFYFVAFHAIEHRRNVKGPWQIEFSSDAAGIPALSISQPTLGIAHVQLVFETAKISETNLARLVRFDVPTTNVPFGNVLFLDTTFLPGTVSLEVFGHKMEFLPRTMLVDQKEIPWRSGETIRLSAAPH